MNGSKSGIRAPRGLRALYRRLRSLPDQLLHDRRYQQAIARLERRPPPQTILVACHGNICRSPYAAAVLARQLSQPAVSRLQVSSAGLVQPGRPCPVEAREAARQRGIELEGHLSRLLPANLAQTADLIVVMEPKQADLIIREYLLDPEVVLILGDLDPDRRGPRAIRDPFGQSLAVFNEVYDRIDRSLIPLAAVLEERHRLEA